MSRALVTFGAGDQAELLEIALPGYDQFADQHGYEVMIPAWPAGDPPRPWSWMKVPALLAALDSHDEALWLDADMVIIDGADDLEVPEEAWQAQVKHHTQDGIVPNCAVWLVRQPMRPFLERAWSMVNYLNAPWWEQTAMCELLGYDANSRPIVRTADTELFKRTHWLDPGWNVHCRDMQDTGRRRIMHATMLDDRAAAMREWAGMVIA